MICSISPWISLSLMSKTPRITWEQHGGPPKWGSYLYKTMSHIAPCPQTSVIRHDKPATVYYMNKLP